MTLRRSFRTATAHGIKVLAVLALVVTARLWQPSNLPGAGASSLCASFTSSSLAAR